MGYALDFIKYRHIRNCYACDPAYVQGVAAAQAACKTDIAKFSLLIPSAYLDCSQYLRHEDATQKLVSEVI